MKIMPIFVSLVLVLPALTHATNASNTSQVAWDRGGDEDRGGGDWNRDNSDRSHSQFDRSSSSYQQGRNQGAAAGWEAGRNSENNNNNNNNGIEPGGLTPFQYMQEQGNQTYQEDLNNPN